MNADDLRAWLASGQDFAQGAALYAQVGASAVYRRLFGLGPSDYARQVLPRELQAVLATLEGDMLPPATPALEMVAVPTEPPVAATPAPAEASPVLAGLFAELRQLRDERSHLHPQLTARGTGVVRRLALAARIVALTHREVELKALVAHVQAHGRLPGPVPLAEVADAGELRRLLTNLRALRSKLRKNPARAADLARVQADIDLIATKLTPTTHD